MKVRPSEKLRELRVRVGLTTRDVADASSKIAEANGNSEFCVSNAWLTVLETSDSVPSVFKLYTLSVLYRVGFNELLKLFGVNPDNAGRDEAVCKQAPRKTGLYPMKSEETASSSNLPAQFPPATNLEATSLATEMVGNWGGVSVSTLQDVDMKRVAYGYIGLGDDFMYPLIRPGSSVQIDTRQNKIRPTIWRTEFDRPIYFVETRDRYICGWCESMQHDLLLLPHPLSKASIQRYRYPGEIEIVGRVIGVAMRIDQRNASLTQTES
jgi:transcriptional regulator with XRE-family HTH domain